MNNFFMLIMLCVTFAFVAITCLTEPEKKASVPVPEEYNINNRKNYPAFKDKQLGFERVRIAYLDAKENVTSSLRKNGIEGDGFELFFRIFKQEEAMELWVKPQNGEKFSLLKTYPFCNNSGKPGPKRKQGDLQIPEGFYEIEVFNPMSSYFLSLGVNYPNKSDKILGSQTDPGGDIYFHGGCATVGCVPITDDLIKEVYITAVEAKTSGQDKIPVHIFPARMTTRNMSPLKRKYPQHAKFWDQLEPGYQFFEDYKTIPAVKIEANGDYKID
ncbi:MAG: L,D-transpeptidase family protein [Bacteroidota bacterium]